MNDWGSADRGFSKQVLLRANGPSARLDIGPKGIRRQNSQKQQKEKSVTILLCCESFAFAFRT
jgi:hypothetical protein